MDFRRRPRDIGIGQHEFGLHLMLGIEPAPPEVDDVPDIFLQRQLVGRLAVDVGKPPRAIAIITA
jgi:hypothetical protein